MALVPNSPTDTDHDTLPDWWELTYGLDPNNAADAAVVQDNGLTPVQARAQQHNPTATANRYLAEGATNTLFDTRLALANPDVLPATRPDPLREDRWLAADADRRRARDAARHGGCRDASAAWARRSSRPPSNPTSRSSSIARCVGRDRRTARTPRRPSPRRRSTWYLAEGATHSGFNLFYLLQNPNATAAQVRVRFLRPSGAPLEKTYTLPPNSRTNIWVNHEDVPGPRHGAGQHRRVGGVRRASTAQPIIVERAMYLDVPGQTFGAGPRERRRHRAGHSSGSSPRARPARFFDLFVLIANPGDADAQVEATYLLPDGTTLVEDRTRVRRQQPLQHLGRLRGRAPGRHRRLDDDPLDQRRADHRRARDVVAGRRSASGTRRTTRRARRRRARAGRWPRARSAARATSRPTS